jgi:ComF family protein
MYGQELLNSERFKMIDVIMPVPLHDKKRKKRGYNQSESFAEGLSNSMKIATDFTSLKRVVNSETQTKKSKYSRWENVNTIFELNEAESLKGKHILLVDDVITTGATVEACAQILMKISDVKISVVAIAFADN